MKLKSILVMSLLSLFASSAFAQWFPGRVFVRVLPGQVVAEVFNPHYEPIVCSGQVFGQTAYGPVFNAFFSQQFMPAGTNRYAYVQTTPYAPFVGGWANIQCRFARFGW